MIVPGGTSLANPLRVGDGVRGLERRQDAFETGERLEPFERFGVGGIRVLGSPEVAQPRMFWADGGVVEPGRDRMRELDVASLVLKHECASPLQDTGASAGKSRRMASRRDAIRRRPLHQSIEHRGLR